jgi:hypothetical protein
MFLKTN